MWVLFIFVVIIFSFYLWIERKNQVMDYLPHPPRKPFIGNLLDLDPNHVHLSFSSFANKYGPLFKLNLFGRTVVVISDPKIVDEALIHTISYMDEEKAEQKGLPYFEATGSHKMTDSLFGSDSFFLQFGKEWHEKRRFFSNKFGTSHLKRSVDIVIQRALVLIDKLKIQPVDESLNMKAEFHRLAFDINGLLSFNYDFDTQRGNGEMDHLFDDIWDHITTRFISPIPFWKVIKTEEVKKHDKAIKYLEDLFNKVLKERKSEPDLDKAEDVLSFMVHHNETGDINYSDKLLRDQVFTFLNGGTDTSSALFTWLIYCLALNPSAEQKLLKELDEVLPDKKLPTYDDLQKLIYTEAFVKETMRLFPPPASGLPRKISKKVKIADYELEAKTEIIVSIYAIHHNPNYWPNPEMFNPDRFLPERKDQIIPYSWIPFGFGPKICIGQRVAIQELKIVLALLAHRFSFTLVPCQTIDTAKGLILHPKDKLHFFVKPR